LDFCRPFHQCFVILAIWKLHYGQLFHSQMDYALEVICTNSDQGSHQEKALLSYY